MFTSPATIAFETPYFTIHWYGIVLAVAFLVGQFVVMKISKKEYNDNQMLENLADIAFWTLLGGVIGARLYYVLLSFDYYIHNLHEIIMIQQGGISIHGAILGGVIAGLIYCKVKKLEFFKYADLYALGLPVAQAIGRWGNFFNSEAYGLPTNLPWAVFIPPISRPDAYLDYEFFHPTFLYESLWNILIFLILYFVLKKVAFNKHGVLFFSYLLLYSIGRILIEYIRIDSVLNVLGLPIAIWASLIIIYISLSFLIFGIKTK